MKITNDKSIIIPIKEYFKIKLYLMKTNKCNNKNFAILSKQEHNIDQVYMLEENAQILCISNEAALQILQELESYLILYNLTMG